MRVAEKVAEVKRDALERILEAKSEAAEREERAAVMAKEAAELQARLARKEAELEEGITTAVRAKTEVTAAEGRAMAAEQRCGCAATTEEAPSTNAFKTPSYPHRLTRPPPVDTRSHSLLRLLFHGLLARATRFSISSRLAFTRQIRRRTQGDHQDSAGVGDPTGEGHARQGRRRIGGCRRWLRCIV